ncbi:hypothetical protein DRJ25_05065 [Candidatus Woesearchaeota archaeon]|nr:MAG: hypothetical protein DRJ25_05065 [Candidatus Woesearchaeota archaeon]
MLIRKRITIIQINKPARHNLNEELQWLAKSLGLFGERDKDRSCFRVFLELLKAAKRHQALSSDELAVRTSLSRGTVVHHLNELMRKGIVVTAGKRYTLREEELTALIDDLKKDSEKFFEKLRRSAEVIDKILE